LYAFAIARTVRRGSARDNAAPPLRAAVRLHRASLPCMTHPRDARLALAIARSLGAQPIVALEIVGAGSVNHVFAVDLGAGARWIVRFGRNPLDPDCSAKEAWCLRAAARRGLAVPDVLATGDFAGVGFLVQSFVAGENADRRRSAELWRTLGRIAHEVNEIALDSSAPEELFGRFGRDPKAAWLAHVHYNAVRLAPDDPLLELGIYAPPDRNRLRSAVESLAERVSDFGLAHGDLVPRNVLLPPRGSPVILDWGSAQVGPVPYLDHLRIQADEAREGFSPADLAAFARGYGVAPLGLSAILADVYLLARLDLVRWALERRPDRLQEIGARSRAAVADWLRVHGARFA